jgi:L-fuculose-phosphate aldolase
MTNPELAANNSRRKIVIAYHQITELGLIKGTAGNISCRSEDGMLITPARANADNLTPERIVSMSLGGKPEGPLKPSIEWQMHAEIYRQIADAHAVIHTHSDYCVALACCNQSIPAFHYMMAAFGGDNVPCAPYETFGSSELAKSAISRLQSRNACLLANHGTICHAPDIETAVSLTHRLEILARQYVLALQIGKPVILDPDEIENVRNRVRNYYG